MHSRLFKLICFLSTLVLLNCLYISSLSENAQQKAEVLVGHVLFKIPTEFTKTDETENSIMYKARQNQVVGWILQFATFDTADTNSAKYYDLDDVGHIYQVLDGLINKENNPSGIIFDEYTKEMTTRKNLPCVILRAATGNMRWYEFVVYYNGIFSKMSYIANIEDNEADDLFDSIISEVDVYK